jgi:hypothetical protein
MEEREFFSKIDFNKTWDEEDWEKFFQAQDAYRLARRTTEVRKKPMSKMQFEGSDEVLAFQPILREYGNGGGPAVVHQLRDKPFAGDDDPEADYHPATNEDPHYWGEGAPLATVLIYRDCCRFAICTSQELDRYLKMRGPAYRRQYNAEFESLRFHANWVAINVAEGHRIGYSDDRIRGNIAKCKRALRHADICMGLLTRISTRTRSTRLRHELYAFAAQLRNGLFAWIDELRDRAA